MSIWSEDEPDLQALNELQIGSMAGQLGIEIVAHDDTSVTARMPVDQRTVQPFGRLHGGASMALAETIGSIAANLTLDNDERFAVGLEINANHIRPAMSGFVYATATAESLGRTTQIWSIRITDEAERLVCLSRLTAAVIPAARV